MFRGGLYQPMSYVQQLCFHGQHYNMHMLDERESQGRMKYHQRYSSEQGEPGWSVYTMYDLAPEKQDSGVIYAT